MFCGQIGEINNGMVIDKATTCQLFELPGYC